MAKASPKSSPRAEVLVSPVALFQIIKDIQMGPINKEGHGSLFGMPADINDPSSSIEVTHAFPSYSPKFRDPRQKLTDPAQQQQYADDVARFMRAHLADVKRLSFDTYDVGTYTSISAGRRLSAADIQDLYERQREFPQAFYLVVVLENASLSVRAFRISDVSLAYLETTDYFEKGAPTFIEEPMLFRNLIVELSVSFALTPLEETILEGMLSNYNLVADVFRLRNPGTMKDAMRQFTYTMDELITELGRIGEDREKLSANREKREQWVAERTAAVARKKGKKAPTQEDPARDVEAVIPKIKPMNKHYAIWHIYQCNARSAALSAEFGEEKTKMLALLALGKTGK
jgi:hypothetical protein